MILRARNRVSVSQNGISRLSIRKRIFVEKKIQNISVKNLNQNHSNIALNNEANVLAVFLDSE